jgi:DNA-binding GntR family transcriptional regulator
MPTQADLMQVDVQAATLGRRATADYIADALRDAINGGQIPDGAELNQVEVAARFGVSRVPVREALRQLQAEGLIEYRAHRLSIVRATDLATLSEVFTLRGLLEGWLVERATPLIDAEALDEARAINAEMRKQTDHATWLVYNARFHRVLNSAAHAPGAMDMLETLRTRSERYVRLWSRGRGVHRPQQTWSEHEEMIRRMAAGDSEGARLQAEEHVAHTRDAVVAVGRIVEEQAAAVGSAERRE